MNTPYVIKWVQETVWAIIVAVVVTLAGVISGISIDQILSDPTAVLAIIGAALARPVGAVVYNQFLKLFGKSE